MKPGYAPAVLHVVVGHKAREDLTLHVHDLTLYQGKFSDWKIIVESLTKPT